MTTPALRLLVICLGNICRSPTAEVVLRHALHAAGLQGRVAVDSAGTAAWNEGLAPDLRSQRHALRRGYDLSSLRARGVVESDFRRFDWLLAMDDDNLADLERMRPEGVQTRLRLFAAAPIPDPYQSGPAGFEQVLDLVEQASNALVAELLRRPELARGNLD